MVLSFSTFLGHILLVLKSFAVVVASVVVVVVVVDVVVLVVVFRIGAFSVTFGGLTESVRIPFIVCTGKLNFGVCGVLMVG